MNKSKKIPDIFFVKRMMIIAVLMLSSRVGLAQQKSNKATLAVKPVSYVDTDLSKAQKFVLRVDGKPFYMTNVQIRLEKLRYQWNFDAAARDAIVGQAAADGFNTVSIPIHWSEVELTKDRFDWTILDEYLGLAAKHQLKMELLWFGHNSGGMVQWLTAERLRVPDYVLHSPGRNSPATTSNYKIRRDLSPYTLDLDDKQLQLRETYVLARVMAHIAQWDKTHGNRHTVIGVQLNNEVAGFDFDSASFTAGQVILYMSGLGSAVKQSAYPVWTRLNAIWGMEEGRIDVNEGLRSTIGTGIDFVGVDLYLAPPNIIRDVLPYKGSNYRMIMECAAEVNDAAQMQLAALAGNNAFDYYDMCGPDGHALYDRSGQTKFLAHGPYIEDVRTVNRLLNSDMADIAKNAQGYGLFVHNWSGKLDETTEGVDGIRFTPGNATSQAISIHRSYNEIVLMNTKGGSFEIPDSIKVLEATYGYFDSNDSWIEKGKSDFKRKNFTTAPGTTVRLLTDRTEPAAMTRIQAEFGSYGLASVVSSAQLGFAGNGYIDFNGAGGYVRWSNIDGGKGGERTIRIRYANGDNTTRKEKLLVNGEGQMIDFPSTGSWETFKTVSVNVQLNSEVKNRISIEWVEAGGGHIDELQVLN